MNTQIILGKFMPLRFILVSLLVLLGWGNTYAAGNIVGPNGEYRESTLDISVKVLTGSVKMKRSWLNGRWYFNPAWADLKFTYDAADGSVKSIDRAGSIFERSGNDIYVYFDRFFIKQNQAGGWRWYDTLSNWIDYDAEGRVISYGDKNDIRVQFERNADHTIATIKNHQGDIVLNYAYANDKIQSISDQIGREVKYQWTGDNLTEVIDVLGNTWQYRYDSKGQITGGTDPESHSWNVTYERSFTAPTLTSTSGVGFTGTGGRDFRVSKVASFTNGNQETTRYEYHYERYKRQWTIIRILPGTNRRIATVYDADGRVKRREEGSTITMERIPDGERVDYYKDERGLRTRKERDHLRNVTKVTYPDGLSETWVYHPRLSVPLEYTDTRGIQTKWAYDARGNELEKIEAVGLQEQRTTSTTWNTNGQMASVTVQGVTATENATTRYTYDAAGNIQTKLDAENTFWTYTYNVIGQIESMLDGRGNSWHSEYNSKGWLISSADPLSNTVQYYYDKVGNRIEIKDARSHSTRFEFDPADRLVKVIDANLGEQSIQYDAEGRIKQQTDASGQTIAIQYDVRGRLWKQTDAVGNSIETLYGDISQGLEGLVAAVQLPTYRLEFKYDLRDRRVATTRVLAPDQRETSYTGYDGGGNQISATDALGHSQHYRYDGLQRQIGMTDALGGVVHYNYDTRHNLLSLTDPKQQTYRYTYDRLNRQTSEIRPLGQTLSYAYDGNGNLITRSDALGQTIQFGYDLANRRTVEQRFGNNTSSANTHIDYKYDENANLIGYQDQMTRADYQFDALNRKINQAVDYGTFSLGQQYDYYANGQLKSYTLPNGVQVNTSYTPNGLLANVAINGAGTISFTDFQWNRAQRITYPGGAERLDELDAIQRLTAYQITDNQGQDLINNGLDYDANDNIIGKTTLHGPYQYAYDAKDRLVSANYPNGSQNDQINSSFQPDTFPYADDHYHYDLADNRTRDQAQTGLDPWQYNANNQLVSIGANLISYNANGSLLETRDANDQVIRRYRYDLNERLIEVLDANDQTIATYYYDPFGRRLWKTVAPNQPGNPEFTDLTTYYYYSDLGYAAELTLSGAHAVGDPNTVDENSTTNQGISVAPNASTPQWRQLYVYRPDTPWSTDPLAIWQSADTANLVIGAGWRYPVNDQLGAPQALMTGSGISTQDMRSTAFGMMQANGEQQGLRFPGQVLDEETGFYYNYYRYYDPSTGRYITSDPIGLQGGLNTYAYVENNPLSFIDPFGLSKTGGKHANKNKPMSVGGFDKNSSPQAVKNAMDKAKEAGKMKHFKNLKGLLKVIQRGGLPGFILGIGLELILFDDAEADTPDTPDTNCK